MYLFFDTETTGFPKSFKAPVTELDNWPRMVQIAWSLCDEAGNERTAAEHIVRPEGFEIPADVVEIHGISTELARVRGAPLPEVLDAVTTDIEKASVLIAHNMSFDEKVLGSELLRSSLPNILDEKTRRCTMRESTRYCRLPGRYGFKWPSLEELHTTLFGESFGGAHQALADVRACARCFFELRRRGVVA